MKIIIVVFLILVSFFGNAQVYDCPLDKGRIVISLKKENYGVNELGTTITSTKNGKVRSFISGKILNVLKDSLSGSYVVVVNNEKEYISFNGLSKVNVKKDDIIKKGEKIGKIKITDKKYTLILMKFIDNKLIPKPFENDLRCIK
ncbi:peptidoglycan DD-metalloendopeptidase family protein [Chryseobacterium sp. MMS23-Vi53]|uniref:peptidoglycan DD-metalloendopeptidase family protein n=1 Tax=Chryseobacterium sp. MMS23-Vi53 TaxID=3386644 RepID=UPI0039EB5E40